MRSGPLRHRIAIQTASESQAASGFPTKTWSTAATRWGSIEPISGREFFNSEKVQANATHRVRMRYDSAQEITPKDRLLWDSRAFNIVHVAKKREINHELEIMVEEVVE